MDWVNVVGWRPIELIIDMKTKSRNIAHTAKDISEADILHWSTKSCAKTYRLEVREIHSGIKQNFEN